MEEKLVQGQSSGIPKSRSRSESTLAAEKKRSDGCEGRSESVRKRVKLRDLESVLKSEGKAANSDVSKGKSGTRPDLNKADSNVESSKGFKCDLNAAQDVSSSRKKNSKRSKLRAEDSECGSTTGGPLGEKDSMKLWKEMKQNGFLSSNAHGGIPMPKPKPRVMSKSSKSDMIKQKMELAKKEQVDRFAKIAAPSGLLNGLNPGIINHVRNSKQVHSIIEALVQSEKQAGRTKTDNQDGRELLSPEEEEDDAETSNETEEMISGNDDVLKQNLSSSNMMHSNQESSNKTDLSHLSVKAADVASQWLDLLHQDIKGRLTALQRSRKRVRAVIRTELPLLISTELSDQQLFCSSNSNNNNAHKARWNALFDQMDTSLSDEEQKLENWLKQVKEMQVHNENIDSSRLTTVDSNQERELAVRAAAASIYSTCNFLQSMEENQPCF